MIKINEQNEGLKAQIIVISEKTFKIYNITIKQPADAIQTDGSIIEIIKMYDHASKSLDKIIKINVA